MFALTKFREAGRLARAGAQACAQGFARSQTRRFPRASRSSYHSFGGTLSSSYAKQYRDPRWFELRKQRLSMDGYTCTGCGNIHGLEVHHVRYIRGRHIWDYPLWLLRTLCESCHIVQTKKQRRARALKRFAGIRFRRWKRGRG